MLEYAILGIIQGITEWLPVSSEGVLVLFLTKLGGYSLEEMLKLSLFLHLGTFLAALIYLRKEVWQLLTSVYQYRNADLRTKRTLTFLILATAVSGVIGILLYQVIREAAEEAELTGKGITLAIGILLLVTAGIQLKKRGGATRTEESLNPCDGLLLGIVQGLSVLPGISRSGITVSTLLLRRFDDAVSLRVSFLLSLPIILLGNIVVNFSDIAFGGAALIGLLFSFLFGILTIHYFFKLATRLNFGYFVLMFGILTIGSVFV